jgi:F-type H+-transporting ATPase subunit b
MLSLFATVAVLAAEGEPEGIDLVLPAIDELVAGVIAFTIVLVLFRWKVLPMVRRTLDARRDAITGRLEEAETAKAEAESLLTDYRKQLDDARTEANRIVDDAKQAAEAVKADIVAKAESEAEAITRKAREEAAAERQRAAEAMRREMIDLTVAMTQKAVGAAVDDDAHRAMISGFLDDLDGME